MSVEENREGGIQQSGVQGIPIKCPGCSATFMIPMTWKAHEAGCPKCHRPMGIPKSIIEQLKVMRRDAKDAVRQRERARKHSEYLKRQQEEPFKRVNQSVSNVTLAQEEKNKNQPIDSEQPSAESEPLPRTFKAKGWVVSVGEYSVKLKPEISLSGNEEFEIPKDEWEKRLFYDKRGQGELIFKPHELAKERHFAMKDDLGRACAQYWFLGELPEENEFLRINEIIAHNEQLEAKQKQNEAQMKRYIGDPSGTPEEKKRFWVRVGGGLLSILILAIIISAVTPESPSTIQSKEPEYNVDVAGYAPQIIFKGGTGTFKFTITNLEAFTLNDVFFSFGPQFAIREYYRILKPVRTTSSSGGRYEIGKDQPEIYGHQDLKVGIYKLRPGESFDIEFDIIALRAGDITCNVKCGGKYTHQFKLKIHER